MILSYKKLIIIIDDDEEDCYFIQCNLQKNHPDYDVLAITDSFQVVEQLEALPRLPHLILLDLHMPISGVDVLTQIKKLSQYDTVPVAILSSLPDPNTVAHVKKMGVAGVIEKSSSFNELPGLVAEILT